MRAKQPIPVTFRCVAATVPGDVGATFTAEMHLDPTRGITYRNVRRVESVRGPDQREATAIQEWAT